MNNDKNNRFNMLLEISLCENLKCYILDNCELFQKTLENNSVVTTLFIARHHARANVVTDKMLFDYATKVIKGQDDITDFEQIFFEPYGTSALKRLGNYLKEFDSLRKARHEFKALFDNMQGKHLHV